MDAVDDHRGKIALLIGDVDGKIAPDILEKIAADWVLKSPFMPKASDLFERAKAENNTDGEKDNIRRHELAELWNRDLYQSGNDRMRWVAHASGGLKLVAVAQLAAVPEPLSTAELSNIAKMGPMGKAILQLGIACGDLTQGEIDRLSVPAL